MAYGTKPKKNKALNIELQIEGVWFTEVDSYMGTTIDSTLNIRQQISKLNQHLSLKLTSTEKLDTTLVRTLHSSYTGSLFCPALMIMT